MSSRVWPPPTEEEEAAAAEVINNPFQEECENCECYPCECGLCGDCGCDPCECDTCDICGYIDDCHCYDCYVVYYTRVTVHVDSDGDITSVIVNSDLGDADDVEDEGGDSVPNGPLRERAFRVSANSEWPSWDIA